eukprot:458580-Prymnesium_polylepis.1
MAPSATRPPVVLAELKRALLESLSRATELFKLADQDRSGQIDKTEFRVALAKTLPAAFHNDTSFDALFDDIDTDRSGSISYNELRQSLRVGALERSRSAFDAGYAGDAGP